MQAGKFLPMCNTDLCRNSICAVGGLPASKFWMGGMSNGNGTYTINPGNGNIQVYCDMTNDDGGWTLGLVCKASNNVCWNTAAIGSVTNPNSATSAKLSDADIKSIMTSGDNYTRTSWYQVPTMYDVPGLTLLQSMTG